MNLVQLISHYIQYRQSLGERFDSNAQILRAFGRAAGETRHPDDVQPEQVAAFIRGKGPITNSRRKRHDAVLGLYQYAISREFAQVNPLPPMAPSLGPSLVPYIYTREEIRRLLRATETYPFQNLCEPITARTVLLLLYGTGVRIREAINLNEEDVDLRNCVLTIRNTKFYKSRLVPFGKQLHRILARYAGQRRPRNTTTGSRPFFTSRTGAKLNQNTFTKLFRRVCNHAGIHRKDARYQPRLHDLRHTFAVHRLTAWYEQDADVQKLLPKLTVYLGHVHLAGTQHYLSMTPELLQTAGQRFEQYEKGIMS